MKGTAVRNETDGADPAPTAPRTTAARRNRRRPRVTEVIIGELRSDIASGRLPLGSKLPSERVLAAEFGVSQPTVREAVCVLDAMGLVEVRHGSGTYVSRNVEDFLAVTLRTVLQMERVGILEALEARDLIGAHSARQAAAKATEADIGAVGDAAARCDEAGTVPSMARAVVDFQCRVSAAAHNPLLYALESFLIKLIMKLQLTAEAERGVEFWREQTARFSRPRHDLHALLVARDADALESAMCAYLAQQRDWFAADPQTVSATLSNPELLRAVDDAFPDLGTDPSGGG